MDKLELKIYRHKLHKDIFLIRKWGLCGTPSFEWFEGTKDIGKYFKEYKNCKGDTLEQEYNEKINDDFYYGSDGKIRVGAKIEIQKEMEFDGYKGTMKKTLELPLDEFELVILKED